MDFSISSIIFLKLITLNYLKLSYYATFSIQSEVIDTFKVSANDCYLEAILLPFVFIFYTITNTWNPSTQIITIPFVLNLYIIFI